MTKTNLPNQLSVLLSTFNGEAYLLEQLDSVYKQTYKSVQIYVRDDGSTDSTLDFLEIEQSQNRLTLFSGDQNIGPAASFFKLLSASDNSSFFAFCDQDDLWSKDKLERAVSALKSISIDTPAMYFSAVECVDERNCFIRLSSMPKKIGFGNALVENIATGCTIVLNKSARNLIVKSLPDKFLMHDSWCYLVISCFGEVVFDPKPTMRYRQHSNNVIGASTSLWNTLARRIKRFSFRKDNVFRFSDQAERFLILYRDSIPLTQKLLLLSVVEAKKSFSKRMKLTMNLKIWRQSTLDDLILRVLILLNRY